MSAAVVAPAEPPASSAGEAATAESLEKAPCRLCGVGCGLRIALQDGRAAAVRGDPASAVSAGLACAKGYYAPQILYGRDRLTRALIRESGGPRRAPVSEALDMVASRLRDTIARHGPGSVALYGSGQWTIPDAYVAQRLFKEGLGVANVGSSTRLHAAAVMAGLESTFGLDGSIGCYEDIDVADVFVLWDANLAESDPVLFSRMLDRRRKDSAVLIIELATRTTRTSYAADHSLLHAPQTLLPLANAVAHEIVQSGGANREFIRQHVAFRRPAADLSRASDDEPVIDAGAPASWDDYRSFLDPITPQLAQELSGVPAERLRWLASLYANPARRVMSVWGPEASQHARGTWVNNALYNIHLLVGKIATPGNAALALTGQPNGGCVAHDAGTATRAPLAIFRALERGDVRFLWIQGTNPMVSLPNLHRFRRAAAREDRFIVVSEAYPTPTTEIADVVLPSAMWIEREGVYGNVERRLQHFDQLVAPPGEAMSDSWQMIEVARRMGLGRLFPGERRGHGGRLYEEYRRSRADPRVALPPLTELRSRPGVLWPFTPLGETRWRFNTSHDAAADKARGSFDFYGHADGRAWMWLRPHEVPAESPDTAYPLWLATGPVLEHWGSGAMTRRVPSLNRAAPRAYLEMHRDDARRLGIRSGDRVRVASRRGTLTLDARVDYRSQPQRGHVFVPSFDETLAVRGLLPDIADPLSGQPEMVWSPVRVERVGSSS